MKCCLLRQEPADAGLQSAAAHRQRRLPNASYETEQAAVQTCCAMDRRQGIADDDSPEKLVYRWNMPIPGGAGVRRPEGL